MNTEIKLVRFNLEIPITEFGSAYIQVRENHRYYPNNPSEALAAMKCMADALNLEIEFVETTES